MHQFQHLGFSSNLKLSLYEALHCAMFKLKELTTGNILVFHVSNGKLAMIISGNDKENDSTLPNTGKAKVVTRSYAGKLLTAANANATLSDQYFPYISLPRVTYLDWKGVQEAGEAIRNSIWRESSETGEDLTKLAQNQESFLGLLGLQLKELPKRPAIHHAVNIVPAVPTTASCLQRKAISRSVISEVEFSARLGQVLASRLPSRTIEVLQQAQQQVSRYEVYCGDTRFIRSGGTYPVTYRGEDSDEEDDLPNQHRLCFNTDQRLERRRSIRYGLSTRSRLLKNQCRGCSVQVTQLAPAVIEAWTSRKDSLRHSCVTINGSTVRQTEVVIDGTIVIQLDDSDDETFTTMPKPHGTHSSTITSTSTMNGWSSSNTAKRNANYDTRWQDSPAKKIKLRPDDLLDVKANCPPYLNGSGPIVRSPQKIWSPLSSKSQSRASGSKSCKRGKKFCYGDATDSSSSEDDEIVCLGYQPRLLATNLSRPPMHNAAVGSMPSNEITRSHTDRGGYHPSTSLVPNDCFVTLEKRGVSVNLINGPNGQPSANGSRHPNGGYSFPTSSDDDDQDLVIDQVMVAGLTQQASSMFAVSDVAVKSELREPVMGHRCFFQCLNCNTRETYYTNGNDATRSIHEHVLQCYTHAEKVKLVTNLDEYAEHGVVHVQAL